MRPEASLQDSRPHPYRPHRARFGAPAVLAGALLLSACLTDGPNRTGGDYLSGHGILLETPLHKVVLSGIPVDSFWTGDLDPVRLGDTIMLLGARDGFSAEARMGFELSDTAFIGTSKQDTSGLWLSLGFPRPTRSAAQLAATATADSMRMVARSWVISDTMTAKGARAETLGVHNRRFLARQDTLSLLPGTAVLDTFKVNVEGAYLATGRDSLQAFALSNLRTALSAGMPKALVYIQLESIPDSADSGSALLRLGGANLGVFTPTLVTGKAPDAGRPTAASKLRKVPPLTYGRSVGTNSRLRFHGSDSSFLVGRTRGLHMRFDRAALLDSLERALERQNSDLVRSPGGEFDLSYFVPYARIDIPLDSVRVDGGFPVEFQMESDVDSLLPAPDRKAASVHTIPLGSSARVAVLTERTNPSKALDTQFVQYDDTVAGDPGLRRLISRSTRDTSNRDTTYLRVGQTREITRFISGLGNDPLIFSVRADSASATVTVHLNTKRVSDDLNTLRDPSTGRLLADLSNRLPRFVTAGQAKLPLRATRGIQTLLNRSRMGTEVESDLFAHPTGGLDQAVADTATKLLVPWPVMGEIKPRLQGGLLAVDLTVYLFPLKDR